MRFNREGKFPPIVTGSAGALAMAAFSVSAAAQEAPVTAPAAVAASLPAEGQPSSSGIADIIVTAQRRSESLKNVPISVQAISSEQLGQKAITDTRDLVTIAPTINFSAGNSANATAFSLRGVSSVANQNGIQPSTAMVVDGVALARQTEFVANLSDIDRIEVLNGPQGTLFGKNSTAGVINIVTKLPTDKLEGLVEGLATTDEEYGIRGLVNLPLSDTVRVRVNAFYRDQNPLVKNLTARDIVGAESYGANIKLSFDLSDTANFLLSGTYAHINSSFGQHVLVGPSIFGAFQQAVIGAATIGRGHPVVNTDEPAIDIFETRNVTGTLNWELSDDLSLISISSYSRSNEDSSVDFDATPVGIIVGKGESTPGTGYPFEGIYVPFRDRYPDRFHYISQEVRLNYQAGPLNLIVGGYYQDYHDKYALRLPVLLDSSLLGLPPGTPFFSSQEPQARIRDTTASLFGDATVALSDQFKLFGGLRFTRERIAVDYHRDDFFGPASLYNPITGVFSGPSTAIDARSKRRLNNLSGRAGVQFQPTEDLNFYASYARGYKAPAVDVSQTYVAGKDQIIKPEIADAFEIGAKLRLLDNRVALNVALFHEKIKDIQLGINQPGVTFTPLLINAGTLKTRGIEADAEWAITPEFRLTGAFTYNKATYAGFNYVCTSTQLDTGTCPNDPVAGFQDITGQQAIGSPKYKYSVGGNYADRFSGSEIGYYIQVNWTWNSSIFYQLGEDPIAREPGHGMLNASIGLKGPDDRWEIQLYGKNLTNKFFYGNVNNVAIIGRPIGNLTRDFKRYGGARLTYRF